MARVNERLLAFARSMRNEPAPAEKKLWRCLRGRQMNGYKFRRQHPVSVFITDYCCVERKLVIELDGDSHSDRRRYDVDRTKYLAGEGWTVIRFENPEIFENLENVLEDILTKLEEPAPPS